MNAIAQKISAQRYSPWWYQISIINCLFKRIVVGWLALIKPEELISIVVYIVFRGGGQPNKKGIEILKNLFILGVNRSVCLINYD